ncbi:unnamed protein product [Pylaiella littoralis]
MAVMRDLDLQGVWDTAQREMALEGSNGCTLERLWGLVGLDGPATDEESAGSGERKKKTGGKKKKKKEEEEKSEQDAKTDPREFVKAWLWRSIIARRGKELLLATYNDKGESNNLKRGDPEDLRLAAIKDMAALEKEQGRVGVVSSRLVRLRALGLDTATLKTVTLVSPAYLQVLEVVGRHRGWGASIAEVLDGVNRIIGSNKKNDYVEVVSNQASKHRDPTKRRSGGFLGSEGMTMMQLYPVYDRLASTGLIFKSIVQKPVNGNEQFTEAQEGVYRYVMLYLKCFKDAILVPPGYRLEPTAKEVFLEMLVDHLLEAGSGAVVPWTNVRKELFLDKNAAGRLRNFLTKENKSPGFPIRIQLLDVRSMDYQSTRRGRRLEWCISLKHSSELEPQALKLPLGISLARSIMAIIKSGGAAGASIDDMQKQLHCLKKPAVKMVEFMVKYPGTYGIWKGYTREGRNSKVQALFYDEKLLGRGDGKPSATSKVTSKQLQSPSGRASGKLTPTAPTPPSSATRAPSSRAAGALAGGVPPGSSAPDVGDGGGGGAGGGSGSGGGGESGLGDVNWSDDEALDAMVDDIGREVDEAQAKSTEKLVEWRVKFERNPVYPPEDCSDATRFAWMQLTPKDRRKNFILHELEQCKTIPVLKLNQLIKMLVGPGPMMQRATLETVLNELVQEGKIKRARAPSPQQWAWRTPMRMFGNGDMILHIDAKTDEASMVSYADNFYALEDAVNREMTRLKSASELAAGLAFFSWDAARSPDRFLVYRREMHRTMILHRELLRCLPKLPNQRMGSRALDLDRVILDTQLSTFLTMFGCPPDSLHTKEVYRVLRKAESRKATVRQAPRAIWELIRTVPWYKEALTSSLQILHDMRILTKTDPPAAAAPASATSRSSAAAPADGNAKAPSTKSAKSAKSASASASAPAPAPAPASPAESADLDAEDPNAYSHVTSQDIQRPSTGEAMAAAAAATTMTASRPGKSGDPSGGGNGAPASIDMFLEAMAAATASLKENLELANLPVASFTSSNKFVRGLRRDKRARTLAAEALLREDSPPAEIRMGLGWAILHVDVVVHTENEKMARPLRVTGHLEWSNFWSTYQFFGTGQRKDLASEDSAARNALWVTDEMAKVEHPIASWLLKKVPYLTDAKEWGVEVDDAEEKNENSRWHRARKLWTSEHDLALIMAVRSYQPEPTFAHSQPPGRPASTTARQALQPLAEILGRTVESCWRRYRNLAMEQAKYAEQGEALPLPVNNRYNKRPLSDGGDANNPDAAAKKRRRTGLLAHKGPLNLSDWGHLQFRASDLNEGRKKAREEAAIAKAAGFEWVNEESSWEEDGRGGGIKPRPFAAWGWTTEELAAYTAVRQLLLVPEKSFDPAGALERIQAFRPPTLQKAYRVLLSSRQIDISQAAWAANDYSVQDTLDHEVYKMIGRHGTSMVSRGIVAAGSLHTTGIAEEWPSPLAGFETPNANDLILSPTALQLKRLCSPPARSGTSGASLAPERPASMVVSDVGRDHAMVTNLLEAVARGRASFAISLPTESLSASEGGPRVGHGVGIGVAARSEGSAGGGGSDGLAIGARGAAGGSETPRVPPRPSAAIPVGAAEGVPPTAGTTTPLSPNRKKTAASSRQPQPPGVGAKTTPSEGPRSTRVIFQAGEPGAGLSAGAGAMDAGSGTGGSKRDDSTPGEGALPTTKYRSARSVDADIMGAMVASVRPRDDDIAVTDTADGGVGAGVVGARRAAPASALAPAANDGRNVYGPEMEWGLSAADGGEAAAAAASDGVAIAAVLGALEDAKEGGMRLSQLGRAAAAACRARAARKSAPRRRDGAGEVEAKQELLELMGRVLRSPEVFCVCDAEDVRYMHRDSCGLWIVPSSAPGVEPASAPVDPSSAVPAPAPAPASASAPAPAPAVPPPPASGTPMDVDAMDEEEEEVEDASKRTSGTKRWKGKGKGKGRARTTMTTTTTASSSSSSRSPHTTLQNGSKQEISLPWTTLDGKVDLRLLNRIRMELVAYVRSNPGCQASDIREAELQYLSGGEAMLLLRDLVRRKVLRDHAVPSTATATLAGGWGASERDGRQWARGLEEGGSDQDVRAAATTSFSLAFNWQGMLSGIEGMPNTW